MALKTPRATDGLEALREPSTFVTQQMTQPQLFAFAGCRVVLFSAPCPGVDRPNQDAAVLIPLDETCGVLAVADGVGGSRGGEEAARLAVESLRRSIRPDEIDPRALRGKILDGFEAANEKVLGLGTGAATTMMAVEVNGTTVRTYHVGDCDAAVVGQRGKIKLRTISHTPSGYGAEAGLLNPREAMEHDERHLLLNLIGSPEMRIDVGSRLMLSPRDTLVLGSDGLFDNWRPERILDRIKSGPLKDTAQNLARATRERMTESSGSRPSKPDDLTFMLLRR